MLPAITPIISGSQNILSTTFSEYSTGTQPPDWTQRFNATGYTALVQASSGSISGRALRWTKTTAVRQLLSWNRVPALPDLEVLVRGRAIEAPATPEALVRVFGRGSGAAGAETGVLAVAYNHSSPTNRWRGAMQRYVAGTGTQFDTTTDGPSPVFAVNAWFYVRFRASGTSFSRKQWWSGNAEPGSWDSTTTDANVTAGGWVGLYNLEANPDVEFDFFGVALRGLTVPIPV